MEDVSLNDLKIHGCTEWEELGPLKQWMFKNEPIKDNKVREAAELFAVDSIDREQLNVFIKASDEDPEHVLSYMEAYEAQYIHEMNQWDSYYGM